MTGISGTGGRRYPAAVGRNGRHAPPRPRIELRQAAASPEEAAAIAAAIEQFLRDTAPPPAASREPGRWLRSAMFEGIGLDSAGQRPWGDPDPWGRTDAMTR